ncbi:MAG: T9SS type A sorting domain-containing protein, partial [Bacteroidota bacterium]
EEGPSSWIVQATGAAGTYYTTSEADGHYEFDIPQGDYAISLQPPVAYWAACNEEAIISLGESTTVEQSVGVSALYECPHLEVDVSAPLLQACSSNYYEVQYCNLGTAVAEGAYVEVQFDPFMTVTSSTLPWSTATDQTYTFPIGEVAPGQCGSFRVAFTLACDAIAGQTHCTEAVIYPNNSCLPDEALWDGASLELAGDCLGDSIQFLIRNIGDSMESPVQYIVVEDHLIMVSGAIQLAAGETRILSTDANGSTKRLEIPQSPGHPGNSHPSLSIEACGVNEDGNVSLGIITTLPEDDGDAFVSMDCQENVETHESNAKRSFPQGIGSSYLIEADNRLDYHLRFQNTGAEPVSTVIIRDTLSSWLNPASVRPGASSHNYEWALSGEGVLTITFANINLPSSSIDETASTGFVKFNIEQQEGNAVGTEIRNESYVYLDDNDPIVMNQTFHTIGENLLVPTKAGVSGTVYLEDGTLLEGVEVTLSTPSGQEQTASNNFIFADLPTLETYHLATAKAATAREGLNVVDLILMIRYILGVEELSPLQQLAADVDGSGLISLSDLIDVQKVILGISNTFPVAPAWQFVRLDRTTLPAAFVSANGISVNSLIHPLDYELYAYKLGDIDESASLMQSSIVPRNQLPMTLRAEAEPLPNGKTLIQLYGQAAWLAEGLQLQLHVGEHRMELMEHEALSALGQLDYVLAEGQLNVVWHSPEAVALPEEALLSFVVDGKVDESWLHFDESHAYQQAYDGQLERHAIRWATQPIAEEQLTVFPNPTRGPITIQYQLVEAGAAAISLMDSKGTVLKSWQEQFPSGQHQLSLSTSDVAPGVYFIHLQTANGMKVQRLIVL